MLFLPRTIRLEVTYYRETERLVSLYVEEGDFPIIIYECTNNPPIRGYKRKKIVESVLCQPQRHLSPINCWNGASKYSFEID